MKTVWTIIGLIILIPFLFVCWVITPSAKHSFDYNKTEIVNHYTGKFVPDDMSYSFLYETNCDGYRTIVGKSDSMFIVLYSLDDTLRVQWFPTQQLLNKALSIGVINSCNLYKCQQYQVKCKNGSFVVRRRYYNAG